MAKIKHNILTEGLSGMVGGKLVFRQMRDGRTIIYVGPDFNHGVWREEQRAHHSRFQQATTYARLGSRANHPYSSRWFEAEHP